MSMGLQFACLCKDPDNDFFRKKHQASAQPPQGPGACDCKWRMCHCHRARSSGVLGKAQCSGHLAPLAMALRCKPHTHTRVNLLFLTVDCRDHTTARRSCVEPPFPKRPPFASLLPCPGNIHLSSPLFNVTPEQTEHDTGDW